MPIREFLITINGVNGVKKFLKAQKHYFLLQKLQVLTENVLNVL